MLGQETEITLKDKNGVALKDTSGKPRKVKFGGVTLPLIRKLGDWIAERVGDPFAEASRLLEIVERQPEGAFKEKLAAEFFAERERAKAVAEQLKYFDLACPLAAKVLNTTEGMVKMTHLLMIVGNPEITEEEALEVFTHIGQEELVKLLSKGAGQAEKNEARPAAPESGVPAWEKTKSIAG